MTPLLTLAPTLALALSPAHAWSSSCFVDAEERLCTDGMEKARHPWVSERGDLIDLDEPEHAQLFTDAVAWSGVPFEVLDPMTLRHASTGDARVGAHALDTWLSIDPTDEAPELAVTRVTRVAGMAQLPDHSYTLWDWARGNEHCPPDADLDETECHQFQSHMGALNASHFPPHSQHFYAYYHQLAMDRAAECGWMDLDIHVHDDVDHLNRYVLACEKQALLIEAIGQHYLQDAWSSGHMWQRWGGVMHDDFESLPLATLTGAYAGTWHGAKAVADRALMGEDVPDWLPEAADDPMCAPPPSGRRVSYIDGMTGEENDGLGDIFRPLMLSDLDYLEQVRGLMSCSVAGLREVYAETRMRHGELGERLPGLQDRDPTGEDCFGQRVTNATLNLGADLHVGTAPNQWGLPNSGTLIAVALRFAAPAEATPSAGEMVRFRRDAGAARFRVRMWSWSDPDGTQAAEGMVGDLVGAQPNGAHLRGRLGDLDAPPAPWLEPALPWTLDGGDNEKALVLAFSDAHSRDICDSLPPERLDALPLWAHDTPPADDFEEEARQVLCEQLAGPFLRIGWPDDYAEDREPLCATLDPDAPVVYSRHQTFAGLSPEAALTEWCAAEPSLLRDGGFEADDSGWTLTDASRTSSVYALTPATGAHMLALAVEPSDGVRSSIASQSLSGVGATSGGDLPAGSYTLRFQRRVLTHEDNHWVDLDTCRAGVNPWFVARLDSPDGNEILHEDDPSTYCDRVVRADGVHYADPAWVEVEVPIDLDADRPGASLTFQVGTSNPHRHTVMIDDVVLERR